MIYRLGVKSDDAGVEDHGVDSAHANPRVWIIMAHARFGPNLGVESAHTEIGQLGAESSHADVWATSVVGSAHTPTSVFNIFTPRLTARRQFTERRAWAPRRFEAKDSSMHQGSASID